MQAWQDRESEVSDFVAALFSEIKQQLGDDPARILSFTWRLMHVVVGEFENWNPPPRSLHIDRINHFARTEAEGFVIKRDLIVRLVHASFHHYQGELQDPTSPEAQVLEHEVNISRTK